MAEKKKIMVVDDDQHIAELISLYLIKEGYETMEIYDGREALEKVDNFQPDMMLLDLMLPSMDGYKVCTEVRKKSDIPIIMLTAKGETFDKVLGLELGADDYVTKPFGIRELVARVKANLRRLEALEKQSSIMVGNQQQYGRISINLDRYEVQKDGKVIDLTYREFELLKFLAQQKGQVFSREALLEKVWGYEYFGDVRTVDVTVRRLREKIEDDPGKPATVLTKRGVGYYFDC